VSPVVTDEGVVIPGELISMDGGKIHAAMAAIVRDIEAVGKGRENQQQRYRFRAIEDVMNVVNKAMAKHEVFLAPADLERIAESRHTSSGGTMNVVHLRMRLRFYATDGSYVDVETWGEGADVADKSTNKAHSQALKYGLTMAFCIPFADMAEPDSEHQEAAPERAREPARRAGVTAWYTNYVHRLGVFLEAATVATPQAKAEANKLWQELKTQAEKGQATFDQAAMLKGKLQEWGKVTPEEAGDGETTG